MTELITGNPWQDGQNPASGNPASYTRFLLPFTYALQPIGNNTQVNGRGDLYFKTFSAACLSRERKLYFTSETANVLYGRATWARVPKAVWQKGTSRCGPFAFNTINSENNLQVTLAPPWIVLFEGQQPSNDGHELLRHGFLIIEAQFDGTEKRPASLDNVLEFNDLFRFMDCPYEEHAVDYAVAMADFPADFQNGQKIKECRQKTFSSIYRNRWLSLLKIPLLLGDDLFSLHTDQALLVDGEKNDYQAHLACDNKRCLLYAENRAFVWTCAILEAGASSLAKRYGGNVVEPWTFGHWLRLLNVDPPQNTPARTHSAISEFERLWLKKRTYQRWANGGTYYGYCYHSGAMIAPPWKPPAPPLWHHFGQMYFDQILLLFYLRITLFAFSRELTNINQENDSAKLHKNFTRLRRSFAKFTNLYQFPLISNQQQGVEMYDLARKSMDIDELFCEVRDEITSTHEFLEMESTAQLGRKANFIACIGLIIALFALPDALWRFIKAYGVILFDIVLLCVILWSYRKRQPQWLWEFIENIRRL